MTYDYENWLQLFSRLGVKKLSLGIELIDSLETLYLLGQCFNECEHYYQWEKWINSGYIFSPTNKVDPYDDLTLNNLLTQLWMQEF